MFIFDFLKVICGVIISVLLGFICFHIFYKNEKFKFTLFEWISYSYGLGAGIITFVMFVLAILHIPLSFSIVISLSLIILGISIRKIRFKTHKINFSYLRSMLPHGYLCYFIYYLGLCFLLFQVILTLLNSFVTPSELYFWDNWAIWGIKTKLFFENNGFPFPLNNYFQNQGYNFSMQSYPLLVPFYETWLAFFLGKVDLQLIKIIFTFFYFSLLVIFYSTLIKMKQINLFKALFFTLFLASIPQLNISAIYGYTDLVLSYYLTASIFLFSTIHDLESNLSRENFFTVVKLLAIPSFFLGFAMWTKHEGKALFLIFISTYLLNDIIQRKKLIKERVFLISLLAGIALLIYFPWFLFVNILGLRHYVINLEYLTLNRIAENIARIPPFFTCLIREFAKFDRWNITWFLLFTVVFLKDVRRLSSSFQKFWFLILISLFYTMVILVVYLVTPTDDHFLNEDMHRLFLHILPLIVLIIALGYSEESEFTSCK